MTKESWWYQKNLLGAGVVALFVFFALLVFTRYTLGDDFPPGDDVIVPLAEGERAPFEGQLFDTNTAIRFGFRIERLRLQLQEDVARAQEICSVQVDLWETKYNLQQERLEFQTSLLRDARDQLQLQVADLAAQLSEAQDVPWYSTFGFGLGVGIVGAVVLSLAVVYAVGAL